MKDVGNTKQNLIENLDIRCCYWKQKLHSHVINYETMRLCATVGSLDAVQ